MINQKYVQFVIIYISIFALWILFIPNESHIKEIGILFLFCFAALFLVTVYIKLLRE